MDVVGDMGEDTGTGGKRVDDTHLMDVGGGKPEVDTGEVNSPGGYGRETPQGDTGGRGRAWGTEQQCR